MQRSRRRNPYPHTWEIPLALLAGVVLILVVGLQVGRSLANLVAGGEWVFVDRRRLFSSAPGLLRGDALAGLSGIAHPASPQLLLAAMVAVELLSLVCMGVAGKAGLDRWGPSRLQGMATRAEAEELLGRVRLRRHARIIRPDLHGSRLTRWVKAWQRSRRAEPSGNAFREVEL